MKSDRRNKIVILTGAYRGIGAMLHEDLSENYTVWPVCRTREQCETLTCSKGDTPGNIRWFHGDLRTPAVYEDIVGELKRIETVPYGIIHCVGPISYTSDAIPPWDTWQEMYEKNMASTIELFRRLVPLMGTGRVVLFGFSGNNIARGYRNIAAYAAAKEALVVLARTAAKEFAKQGTTVNVIAPGVFETDKGEIPAQGRSLKSMILMNRFGVKWDVTGVVKWLLGKESEYVTGQIIKVSGGLHIS